MTLRYCGGWTAVGWICLCLSPGNGWGQVPGRLPSSLTAQPAPATPKQQQPPNPNQNQQPAANQNQPPATTETTPAPSSTTTDAEPRLDVFSLSASRVSSTTQQNPGAASSVISSRDISSSTSASTTGELLERAASVSTRRTSALNLDPRVRGYKSTQIMASANGATQWKSRIDVDSAFSNIDPGIVSSLTVVDGPYTSLYGPGFSFLVAELSPTQRFEDGPEWHGSSIFSHGTNGRTIYARENIWGGAADWGFYASYGFRTGNDYHPGDNSSEFRVPASYHRWDGFFGVGVDLDVRSRVEFNYIRVEQSDMELPGVTYDIFNQKNDSYNVRYVIQEDRDGPEQFVLQYWADHTRYYGDDTFESKRRTVPDFVGFNGAQGFLESQGVRALATWGDNDEVQLTAGTDYRRYNQFYNETTVFGFDPSSREDYGIFANLKIPVSEDITFTVGGRGDLTDDFTIEPVRSQHEVLGMGYATTQIKLSDVWSVNTGAAYAMRNPALGELYYGVTNGPTIVPVVRSGNNVVTGDPNLDPERNLQFDLGLTRQFEEATFTVRGFHAEIQNYVTLRRLFDGAFVDSFQYYNTERASLYGGEIIGDIRLLEWLAASGSVAYVKGTNHSPRDFGNAPIPGAEALPDIYPLNSTIILHFFGREDDRGGIDFVTRMVMGQHYVADSLGESETPGFTTFDLRGFYKLRENFRVTAAVENLLDRTYTEHGSLRIANPSGPASFLTNFVKEPGITFRTGVEITY